jgi:trk system potassium uptake protein
MVVLGLAATIGIVTLLLLVPAAYEPGREPSFRVALFTGTGACSGGLPIVDTPTHWSTFGEVVIIVGIQLGGLGFMTSASLLGLAVSRRLGLRTRLFAATETQTLGIGDIRRVLLGVARVTFAVEAAVAVVLFPRLWLGYDEPAGRAAYDAVFHAVSAFNNGGYALYSGNLVRFVADPVVILPIVAAVIVGGLGFPVLFELRRELRTPRYWSMHTKVTVFGYGLLLLGGTVAVTAFEWRNAGTLGPLDVPGKILAGFFGSTTARTAGFNSIDYAQVEPATLVVTDVLMFVGGGSASTAGGIKVTTFMILFFAILAEARGDETVDAFTRQVSPSAVRQALAVALLGVALVVTGTLVILSVTDFSLDQVLFEVTSAFATAGLSTGITGQLPAFGQYVLIVLMFVGRVGPITLASALALRQRRRLYRLPEERPIVG